MTTLILITLGLLYTNLMEWCIHKYILHDRGKVKGSWFSHHWHEHHRISRKNDFLDDTYSITCLKENYMEVGGLTFLALVHIPLYFLLPTFFFAAMAGLVIYYILHASSHLYPKWGKKWMRWHYDHHMGRNQDANWCVTIPLFDYLFKTRIKYEYDGHKPLREIK